VRRLPTIMLGALMLPVGFLPTAAFADSAPAVTATATPTPTSTETPSSESTVEPSATVSPTATPTAKPTPPDGDILSGQFSMQPDHGKPGTVITVKSTTPCVDGAGKVGPQVEFVMFNEADLDGPLTVDKVISTDASGAWTTTAKVPATAKDGDLLFVIAACFAEGSPAGLDGTPFLIYDPQEFTVTKADKAPIATPVPGDPHFTG
jgi:hypothetical protein